MTESLQNAESISLWECLHDGSITSFDSDLMARTLTILVDSPYHWEFHKLSPDTRFRITGKNVRIAEVFDFEPWIGAREPTRETPWKEAQAQRQKDYKKGRLVSTDWHTFAAETKTDEGYEVMNAELTENQPLAVLELEIMNYPNSSYRTVRIHAEHFIFLVGERLLTLPEFQEFGSKYWDDWSQKSKQQESLTEAAKQEIWNGTGQQDV